MHCSPILPDGASNNGYFEVFGTLILENINIMHMSPSYHNGFIYMSQNEQDVYDENGYPLQDGSGNYIRDCYAGSLQATNCIFQNNTKSVIGFGIRNCNVNLEILLQLQRILQNVRIVIV